MKYNLLVAAVTVSFPVVAHSDVPAAISDGMYITVDEVRANSMDTFEMFAGSEGGPISRSEFISTNVPDDVLANASERQLLEQLFGMLDADGNGQLTLSEWRSRISRDLEFADQNGDGRITLKELSNARENMSVGETLGMVF